MYCNAYAFDRHGNMLVIELSIPEHEAVRRCEAEAAFITAMGDPVERYGNTWYGDGYAVRVCYCPVEHDTTETPLNKLQWLPDDDYWLNYEKCSSNDMKIYLE